MATKEELQSQLAANEAQRNSLAAKLGPATDAAQQAYNTASFFNPEGKTFSDGWTGSLNGQRFTDPNALYAAAQSDFQQKADYRKQLATEFNALFPAKDKLEADIAAAGDATSTVKTPSASAGDATAAASNEKMAGAEIEGDTGDGSEEVTNDGSIPEAQIGLLNDDDVLGVPPGAVPLEAKSAKVSVVDAQGNGQKTDLRVIIQVPADYLVPLTAGHRGELARLKGIIFPYTPSISYEHKADYAESKPMHSNFSIYFYQRSSISSISISGKFTVQNEADARNYLATMHLLRALTKMRAGDDSERGAPPPVCRLEAYGNLMMDNTPVAITGFKVDLPVECDYFTLGKLKPDSVYGVASVPIVSNLSITCIPMYSRAEMQDFSVTGWLNSTNLRLSGIL